MDVAELLDELINFGQHDWIPLWMIVDDVESELDPDDEEATLELVLTLAEGLMRSGFLAGEVPIASAAYFTAWPSQEPSAVREYIRREWNKRGGRPEWGESPWFAALRCASGHA
jgi:hypothetical protein